jgi:hypothetical protein
MASVLDSYLTLLESDPGMGPSGVAAERAIAVEESVAVHSAIFDVMERRIGPGGLNHMHRPMIPLFQRWITVARRIVADARELRLAGHPLKGIDDLLRAINHAKLVAEYFDETVAMNERIGRNEPGAYHPLAEIRDELR